MKIGIKFDIGFSENNVYRHLYGRRDPLQYLRQWGVQAVETPIGPDTEKNQLLDHVRKCSRAGLLVSFHPYTEGTAYNLAVFSKSGENPCRKMHERFFEYGREAASIQEREVVINIHPAAWPPEFSRSDLVDRSVQFFEWSLQWCGRNAPHVRPVAELQYRPEPWESNQRIGDEYDELLQIVERSGIGACWDFAHAFMNSRRFGHPLQPPVELLRRIVHVHCHDADREDHQPLIHGNVPWKEMLKSLMASGFDGTVVLEVPPGHFLASGGTESLECSLQALREFVSGKQNP